jgi:hypothetical protein
MPSVSSLRLPPLRRPAYGLALIASVLLLALLAAAPPAAAYSCSAPEGRTPASRVTDCRRPLRAPKEQPRRSKAAEEGRIGAGPLLLLVLAVAGTLVLPIGFDRMSRQADPDRLLR